MPDCWRGQELLTGVQPELMEKMCREVEGEAIGKVLRIVKNRQVFYSKEYTRMVKRNAYAVLLLSGQVREIQFFVWDRH